ncbi:unnamed protein product [Mytilus coruscus]|uniref:Uncharacterized protein n=1 Tax=Mytilus coruscus TaxID=42192 RepID=A0A6J8DF98_MYTCO|nr:unnamed protein product [Mytilus coruscus]CAC5406052.1 unnamed protein product [Mytilus coruscus]
MGNSSSINESEDGPETTKMDDNSDSEDTGDKETPAVRDLNELFDHSALRNLVSKFKEEITENVLQQYRTQILRWLDDKDSKQEETISIAQFCDWLMTKSVSRDDAIKTFQQFDTDGSGVVETSTMIETVKSMSGPNLQGELGRSIRMMQACSLTPGFVDVYAGDKNAVKQHAEKILKYLLRNRCPSSFLPFPLLNGFNNTANMRGSVLKHVFKNIKESGPSFSQEGVLGSGEELRTISPCHNNIEVSSNSSESYRLTNGDPNTYWQSDGTARSHWIRYSIMIITYENKRCNKDIISSSGDSSYMPELIHIVAGKNFRSLRQLKEIRIPSHVTGDVVLLKNCKIYYPIIQINIKRCRNDGCDTRIHGIKTVGYKVMKELGINVGDAAAVWYIQILASTVTMTLPLNPQLRPMVLEHTRRALDNIPPLSLCPASTERPKFLSKYVLQEVEKFVTDIALNDGEVVQEGLHMLLSFNLARGNVGGILRTLKLLQEFPETTLPCSELLRKMLQARDSCWEKSGHQLPVTILGTDGGKSDDNSGPENLLNHTWTSLPVEAFYTTEEGKTKCNIIFKSTEFIQITRIRLKNAQGSKGVRRGLLFVYRDSNEKFNLEEHTKRFESYNDWGKMEYDFSVQVRGAGIAGKPDNPIAYFTFEDDCNEIDIPVTWHPVGQYILIKLLEPRQEKETKLSVAGVRFYGFPRKQVLIDDEVSVKHPPNPDKKPNCNSLEIIQHVLEFIVDLAQDQVKKGISSGKSDYLEFGDTPIDTLWELYTAFRDNDQEKWQSCAILMLQLMYCLLPVSSAPEGEKKKCAEEMFQHFCKVIDDSSVVKTSKKYRLCKQLIVEGKLPSKVIDDSSVVKTSKKYRLCKQLIVEGKLPNKVIDDSSVVKTSKKYRLCKQLIVEGKLPSKVIDDSAVVKTSKKYRLCKQLIVEVVKTSKKYRLCKQLIVKGKLPSKVIDNSSVVKTSKKYRLCKQLIVKGKLPSKVINDSSVVKTSKKYRLCKQLIVEGKLPSKVIDDSLVVKTSKKYRLCKQLIVEESKLPSKVIDYSSVVKTSKKYRLCKQLIVEGKLPNKVIDDSSVVKTSKKYRLCKQLIVVGKLPSKVIDDSAVVKTGKKYRLCKQLIVEVGKLPSKVIDDSSVVKTSKKYRLCKQLIVEGKLPSKVIDDSAVVKTSKKYRLCKQLIVEGKLPSKVIDDSAVVKTSKKYRLCEQLIVQGKLPNKVIDDSAVVKISKKYRLCKQLIVEGKLPNKVINDSSVVKTSKKYRLCKQLIVEGKLPSKVIDDSSVVKTSKKYRLCKQLIVEGAAMFFPDKDARRKQLFSMMHHVENLSKSPSVMLVFQSLCRFFSSVDPSGLLELPNQVKEDYNSQAVLDIMETMLSVTYHEFTDTLDTGECHEQVIHLLELVCSLQTSLLSWCWSHMLEEENRTDLQKEKVIEISYQYSMSVAKKGTNACKLLLKQTKEKLMEFFKIPNSSFLGNIIRQLIMMLTYICDYCGSTARVVLIHSFQHLVLDLNDLAKMLPEIFPNITSDHWSTVQTDDIVLRTWEVESSHSYHNNEHETQVFGCPGANRFIVDFDPRCETERRYDYLMFTDATGYQMKFDQRVGSNKWPRQVQFTGPHVHFLFHSDNSNTEWGYKFKVTARGSPDVPLSWPFDLQLSLTKLMGRLCGATLASNSQAVKTLAIGPEDTAEQDVLRSELWTTLFRGGYMIGKLQHSLSGKFQAESSGTVLEFLLEVIDRKEGAPFRLIEKCRDHNKGLQVGGETIENAVIAVFTALIWHTQQLREDLQKYIAVSIGDHCVSDGILHAYSTAESIRMQLLHLRQKIAAAEKEEENDEEPALVCKDKALYLLKFAGLTKIQLKNEMRSKAAKQWKKLSNKKNEKIKLDVTDKYPSFRLVLEFVQDPAWTTERVNRMIQERVNHAKAISDVYSFTAEFLRIHCLSVSNGIFQIPAVLFFQELLSYQDGFAKHYADGLDGCGLQQEAKVRQAYYQLIRRLSEPFHNLHKHELDKKIMPAYEFIQACLLHLLDIEWQAYDLTFVTETKLPSLYLDVAKETVKMRDCMVDHQDEDNQLKEYDKFIKWFEDCSSGFEEWYEKNKVDDPKFKEEKRQVQMFVARFCDLLEVEISCDGCGVTLPGRRYRCLQCSDMDLCATCFAGGVKPEGDHADDHEFVHLVYKCNMCQAFIVGTRIHCSQCEDFDLCIGCHNKGSFPKEHNADHDITKFPMIKLKTSQSSDSMIQAYIHQHVWLLFTVQALATGDIIHNTNQYPDPDYIKLAAQLQSQCIDAVTHCLQQVPDDAEDGSKDILQEGRSLEQRQEEAFAIHSQERVMGLLGAMIPADSKSTLPGVTFNFSTVEFIQLLFKIAKGESGHEVNTQHLAMGLLGPLLKKSSPKVADEAVITKDWTSEVEGQKSIKYLFSFGANCLEKWGLELACSVAIF